MNTSFSNESGNLIPNHNSDFSLDPLHRKTMEDFGNSLSKRNREDMKPLLARIIPSQVDRLRQRIEIQKLEAYSENQVEIYGILSEWLQKDLKNQMNTYLEQQTINMDAASAKVAMQQIESTFDFLNNRLHTIIVNIQSRIENLSNIKDLETRCKLEQLLKNSLDRQIELMNQEVELLNSRRREARYR